MANPNVLRERQHVIERIEYIMVRVSDDERNYSDNDRTTLMNRLEGYIIRLMKLPTPGDPSTRTKQNEIYDKYESLVVADLDEVKKSVRFIAGFLRRHRNRMRRQLGTGVQQ
jgi:ribosomal protein S17E